MVSTNDKTTLFFIDEEDTKTLVDALIRSYRAADLSARCAKTELAKSREEVAELKKKLDEAEKKVVVLDTAYNDMDEERSEWREKYMKLLADVGKSVESRGE